MSDCLSVDISEWDKPGILYGKTAKQCTREEVAREVWAQLKAALNDTGQTVLSDSKLHSWFLDPGVSGIGTPDPRNEDELLIHPTGTFHNRPTAATRIPNFYLAGDYVAVPIDLATMEGANTSGRLAANALLDAVGSSAARCTVTPLYSAPELDLLKSTDRWRYRLGLPNAFDLG
ncbi:FAD-dependent oxidoreductase [Streptomyces sp. NPDC007172]|uniref:FAD-dependent oxidoreductase n=1 Tax=Streptomyces sp. NPDC007172 TaxID=3364776 RepID=UPI0036C278C5